MFFFFVSKRFRFWYGDDAWAFFLLFLNFCSTPVDKRRGGRYTKSIVFIGCFWLHTLVYGVFV